MSNFCGRFWPILLKSSHRINRDYNSGIDNEFFNEIGRTETVAISLQPTFERQVSGEAAGRSECEVRAK